MTCVPWYPLYVFDISDPPLVRFVFAACLRLLSGRHTPRLIKSQWGPCTALACTALAQHCHHPDAALYWLRYVLLQELCCTLAVHLRSPTTTTITVGCALKKSSGIFWISRNPQRKGGDHDEQNTPFIIITHHIQCNLFWNSLHVGWFARQMVVADS